MSGSTTEIDRLIEQGLSLYGEGDLDGALQLWERALVIEPENAQATSYVDYVRMNYDLLNSDGTTEHSGPFGIGADDPDYQIEILPSEAGDSGKSAAPPMFMDAGDAGDQREDWQISDESGAHPRPAREPELELETAATARRSRKDLAREAQEAQSFESSTGESVSFDANTREYEGRRPDPEMFRDETPPFGSTRDLQTPQDFGSQLTDVRRRDLGFVQPTGRATDPPPELKMTLRTPGATQPPPEAAPAKPAAKPVTTPPMPRLIVDGLGQPAAGSAERPRGGVDRHRAETADGEPDDDVITAVASQSRTLDLGAPVPEADSNAYDSLDLDLSTPMPGRVATPVISRVPTPAAREPSSPSAIHRRVTLDLSATSDAEISLELGEPVDDLADALGDAIDDAADEEALTGDDTGDDVPTRAQVARTKSYDALDPALDLARPTVHDLRDRDAHAQTDLIGTLPSPRPTGTRPLRDSASSLGDALDSKKTRELEPAMSNAPTQELPQRMQLDPLLSAQPDPHLSAAFTRDFADKPTEKVRPDAPARGELRTGTPTPMMRPGTPTIPAPSTTSTPRQATTPSALAAGRPASTPPPSRPASAPPASLSSRPATTPPASSASPASRPASTPPPSRAPLATATTTRIPTLGTSPPATKATGSAPVLPLPAPPSITTTPIQLPTAAAIAAAMPSSPGPIRTDDPMISAPTRELGLRTERRPSTEDEPTAEVDVHRIRSSARTTSKPPMPGMDPIDARSAEILEETDRNAPTTETREDRTRRRITALLERATEWGRGGDVERSVTAVDLALSEDPNSALAQKLIHRNRDAIMNAFQNFLGDLQRVPALARPLHELGSAPISPRAAFLLSRVDGTLSLDEILDVSGMPRLEAYRYLCQLLLRGILR